MRSHCSRERFAKVLREVCARHVGDLATLQKQLLFRLPIAFSRVGKKQTGSLNQIGSFDHIAFPQPGKKQIESLNHFAFSRAGKKQIGSLSQIWQKQFEPKKLSNKQFVSDLQTKIKQIWPNG